MDWNRYHRKYGKGTPTESKLMKWVVDHSWLVAVAIAILLFLV